MVNQTTLKFFVFLLLTLGAIGAVNAQATRTWVSGVGDDANPCSRTAPCKTFAGAISKTAPGGVIDVLDPGGFGAVTITKAITLEAIGSISGILVSGTNGVVVAAGPNDIVVLRGMSFEGLNTGLDAVRFTSGGQLIVERSDISHFANNGINFLPNSAATLVVRDTTIHDNGSSGAPNTAGGINIAPASGGSANALLDDVRIVNGAGFGLQVAGASSVTLRNSSVSLNAGNGLVVPSSTGATTLVTADHDLFSGNSQTGIFVTGSTSQVHLTDSTVTNNTQGLRTLSSGSVVSFGNNRIFGNVVNNAPTSTTPLQ